MQSTFLSLPLFFGLLFFTFSANGNSLTIETQSSEGDTIYSFVEQMPEFPGGIQGMLEFINSKKRYPEQALEDRAEGRIMVRFVVNKKGEVTDASVRIGVHPDLDNEALRVIKSMPKWKPGKKDGEIVNVQFILPVEFKLPEEEEE